MKSGILILVSISLLLTSCVNQKEIAVESTEYYEPICSYTYARSHPDFSDLSSEKKYRAISQVIIFEVIKDSDTLDIKELNCVDSIRFTQAFNGIDVREMCIEMGDTRKDLLLSKNEQIRWF